MSSGTSGAPTDWARYWRAERQPIEAMHAHFSSHVYHRHSHDSYSFGMTESGRWSSMSTWPPRSRD